MQAHKEMTDADITYADVKKAADRNGISVGHVLETIGKTADKDRLVYASEYSEAKSS